MTELPPDEIRSQLTSCDQIARLPFKKNSRAFTSGDLEHYIVELVKVSTSYWMMEEISSSKSELEKHQFQSWKYTMNIEYSTGTLSCTDSNDKTLYHEEIDEISDYLPNGFEIVCDGGLMLVPTNVLPVIPSPKNFSWSLFSPAQNIVPGFTVARLTDGVLKMAKLCEANWLIKLICSHQPELKGHMFQFWKLTAKRPDGSRKVTCCSKNGKLMVEQMLPHQHFPLPEGIELYYVGGVIVLASEY
jgi:hypothetical protein